METKYGRRITAVVLLLSVAATSAAYESPSQRPAPTAGSAPHVLEFATRDATALMQAARAGDLASVRTLLSRGADIDARAPDRATALIVAASAGHADVVTVLLQRGAGVNRRTQSGHTALMASAYNGHASVVRILLQAGADVHIRTRPGALEETALHDAAVNGHTEVIHLLLDAGADINAHDRLGFSPLMYAALNGRLEAVRHLLEDGADPTIRGYQDHTALTLATEGRHDAVIKLLQQTGAARVRPHTR